MTPPPPRIRFRRTNTHRLIPSRYPPVGILDVVATPEDLAAVLELEGWTNDRIAAELGVLHRIPRDEWVVGRAHASVIMAAFCHPNPAGGRFNDADRGAWYGAFDLPTCHAEVIFHRTRELAEIGLTEARVQMRQYLADFDAEFHDVRGDHQRFAPLHHPAHLQAAQTLARRLRADGGNGLLYRSVRRAGGECLVCFRPALITNVRPAAHFEYRWHGGHQPTIQRL